MKTRIFNLGIAGIILSAMVSTSCQKKDEMAGGTAQYASIIDVADDGVTDVNVTNLKSALVLTPALNNDELTGLLLIKNDEKLARDIYTLFSETQVLPIFNRIAQSEIRHLQAVTALLANYNIADSLTGYGVFANADVQKLYNDLSGQGNTTEGALKTGATIEELDIRDLTQLISQTSNANLIIVYENLLKGSRNHLRAFNRQLINVGSSYTPQYLEQATYDQIVNSSFEKGKQYKMHGNGKGKGNGKGMKNGNGHGNGDGTCLNQ
jgi:hypothetical protein